MSARYARIYENDAAAARAWKRQTYDHARAIMNCIAARVHYGNIRLQLREERGELEPWERGDSS